MSKEADKTQTQDARYLIALLESLEERKKSKDIDQELYNRLKEQYSRELETAKDKSTIRDGFVTFQVLAPNLKEIRFSTERLLDHFSSVANEKAKIEKRIVKLAELFTQERISEEMHDRKKREYEVLILKLEEERLKLLRAMPDSLVVIKDARKAIDEQLEETEAAIALGEEKRKKQKEKKELEKIGKDLSFAQKELSKLLGEEFPEKVPVAKKAPIEVPQRPEDKMKAEISPLAQTIPTRNAPAMEIPTVSPAISEEKDVWASWKEIQIGKLIGDLTIVGATFAIILTDRPSLAMIRDFSLGGLSQLKPTSNLKMIEEKLRKLVQNAYGINEEEALFPKHLVKFAIEKAVGIDPLKLINSYYASVGRGAVAVEEERAIINPNAQVLSLLENANLLGRRVLAPDQSLIGVVHELYLDPTSLQLYTFAFKGVPPQIIRNIYRQTHARTLSEGTFGAFRNEISKKLSIPIYEALTPSSIIKFCMMSGVIKNLNQLVTLIESMNPRVSRMTDISSITTRGVHLSRFPQNSLPRIEYAEF